MPYQKQTVGYDGRLREALQHAGMTVYGVHQQLKRDPRLRGLRGTSATGVRSYFVEDPKPPEQPRLELLRAFATVLGVRYEWLAFGAGERTEKEQEAADAAAAASVMDMEAGGVTPRESVDMAASMLHAIAEGAGTIDGPRARMPASVIAAWGRRRFAYYKAAGKGEGEVVVRDDAIAREIGTALVAPLKALGLTPRDLTEAEFQNFTLAMVAALVPIAHIHPQENTDGEA